MRVVDPHGADDLARHGIDNLQQSAHLIPHEELDWSLLDNWEDRQFAVRRVWDYCISHDRSVALKYL